MSRVQHYTEFTRLMRRVRWLLWSYVLAVACVLGALFYWR